MSTHYRVIPRSHPVAAAVALVVAGLCASPLSHAGSVDLQGLADNTAHQQFIVAYRPGSAPASSLAGAARSLQRAADALPRKGGRAVQVRALRRMAIGSTVVRTSVPLDAAEAEQLLRALALQQDVDAVQVDAILRPSWDPDDPRLAEQWAFGASNASLGIRPAWDIARGKGVVVAVIDTGITGHPDLDANILPGYDFISDPAMSRDGDGRDGDATDAGDWYPPGECNSAGGSRSSWHGTHVAGTVAASTHNGIGVAGTAFNAKVVPVRVLGRCGGFQSDIADGIVWAAGGRVPGVADNPHPAQVVNLSLGGFGTCDRASQAAVDTAIAHGASVVVAAGNSNDDVARYRPANCRGVIAVAATNAAGSRASFSNYGARITVAAPGESILSTLNDGQHGPAQPSYAAYSGTSMAAPHVAGVVALMQSVAPKPLLPAQVDALLRSAARPLPGTCTGGCGAGLVDAAVVVARAAAGDTGPDPDPDPDPDPSDLENDVPVRGLSGTAGSERWYTFNVPAGSNMLVVQIGEGSGDVDLYTRHALRPTDTEYNCRPQGTGNSKTCVRVWPGSGTWHIRIKAITDYSGLMVKAKAE